VVSKDETLEEVKVGVENKLKVPNEELSNA
jgi:hypothetical protein